MSNTSSELEPIRNVMIGFGIGIVILGLVMLILSVV